MIKGRNIIVIGLGGIGKPFARRLVEGGARVVFSSRTESNLLVASEGLPVRQVLVAPADATDPGQMLELFQKAKTKFGNVDAVVIAAGSWKRVSIETEMDEAMSLMKEHLRDFAQVRFVVGMVAQKFFREQGHGLIVNFSSHAAMRPELGGNLSYVLGHAAGHHFMLNLRHELLGSDVRVVNIAPAIVNTPGNERWLKTDEERQKAVQPEEMADWLIENFDNPDIPDTKLFDSSVRLK